MVDLPRATATWVLSAHVLTVLSPLVLVWATGTFAEALAQTTFAPGLFYLAALLLVFGSAIECAQNHRDDWYLTNNDPSVLDGIFNSLIVASLALVALACQGQHLWLWPVVVLAALAYPVMYFKGWPKEIIQGVLGLVYTACLYLSFRDPVVLFPLLTVFLTLYFLDILLKTRAQSMHGFTTIVNAVGLMAIPWAMYAAAVGAPANWLLVILSCVLVVVLAMALRPVLLKLSPTERPSERPRPPGYKEEPCRTKA
jgi:hypothetical protein